MDDAAMIDYFSSSSGHFWVPQAVNDRNYWWLSCEPVLALGCVSFTLANQTHDVFYGTKLLLQSVVYRMSFQSLCLPCSYIRAQWQTASLTQNQCLQCVTHVELPRPRDATELSNDGMHDQAGRPPLPNKTQFIHFSDRDFINDDSSFCSHILLAIDLQGHVFPFEKLLLNVRLCL